jgi:hypothetical protein
MKSALLLARGTKTDDRKGFASQLRADYGDEKRAVQFADQSKSSEAGSARLRGKNDRAVKVESVLDITEIQAVLGEVGKALGFIPDDFHTLL